ncbi:MAG TPA: Fis family transcriptional regulator [Luteimonas sp.]|nr:Fis family transcriptional regulator [Luteimonas sp.]
MATNKHIGSDFDAFLQEQGLLEESSAVALKRVIAWQLAEAMKAQGVTKSAMASRMQTSRSQLDRVLGAHGSGMTLETLSRAIDALGLRIRLEMQGNPALQKAARKNPVKKIRRPTTGHKPTTATAVRKRA